MGSLNASTPAQRHLQLGHIPSDHEVDRMIADVGAGVKQLLREKPSWGLIQATPEEATAALLGFPVERPADWEAFASDLRRSMVRGLGLHAGHC